MVSVIITTYNRAMAILKRAIDTVYNQTYKDIELIVVNDYPQNKEEIQKLLGQYKDICFISHERQMGACQARNDGLVRSNGDYIAFLDDDDEWDRTKIEKQIQCIEKTKADFVYCKGTSVNDITGEKGEMPFIRECSSGQYIAELIKENFMGGCSFPLIRRKALFELGGFDVDMPSSQDYELWFRIAENKSIVFLDEALVLYHVGLEAITGNPEKRIDGFCRLYRKHRMTFGKYPKETYVFFCKLVWTAIYTEREDLLTAIFREQDLSLIDNAKLHIYAQSEIMKGKAKRLIMGKEKNT